jgi:Zn-dependent M16 (insulinase) family peptidase
LNEKIITRSQGYKFSKQIIGNWIHEVHSFSLLDSSWEIERLQHLLAVQPYYFELIMKNRIIDNQHRLDLTMSGSTDVNDVQLRIEKQRVREIKMQMSATEKHQLVFIADSLKKTTSIA